MRQHIILASPVLLLLVSTATADDRPTPSEILVQTPIFVAGAGGYHTYRIPALIVAPDGAVLAICEGRKHSSADHGDIDLTMRRSADHGLTWSPQVKLADDGDHTMGNPCPVVDRTTGVVWLPFCRDNDTVHIMSSRDSGATWSPAIDITGQVKLASWGRGWYATGPTHGIQLTHGPHRGRLVIPCDHKTDKLMYSHVFFSDDHGGTWKLGNSLDRDTDECGVVELVDGTLQINMRSYRRRNRRAVAHSQDGGETWSAVQDDPTLIEPVCQGNLLRLSTEKSHDRNRILFSNPASTKRVNVTVRVSYDEGRTWSVDKPLHRGPSAYSDLTIIADGMIGCLYERGAKRAYETITFAKFNLEWLTDGTDTLRPRG